MQWKGRRQSSNVRDARGSRSPRGASSRGSGGLATILSLAFRTLGLKGVLVVGVLGAIGWKLGLLEPSNLLAEPGPRSTYETSPVEEERLSFVKVVLADCEDIWNEQFRTLGRSYVEPQLVVYTDTHRTACGMGDARMGPFYCPGDDTIYIDLGFYDELERSLDAPGDFAQAYVIAHEVGHHIQNLLGLTDKVNARRGKPDENEYSVRLELQADFLAGVWAHHNRHYLDRGDIEEAMRAANQIGDDALQARSKGRVVPHTFTHGTSEQRMRWFQRGLESGRFEDGDTFALRYEDL